MFFSCSHKKRTKRMRDRSGRSDLCKRSAFTRCSRHVFAQASLCKPRRNTQRGCRLRLIGFAPAGAGGFRGFCLRAGATADRFCACGRGKSTHRSPRAADGKPYAVSVFSAAVRPARDKVPCRTDFSLRRAPPYFLSTGQENVREPHFSRLFFAQTVKRCACGFFFVLFLSAKKKNILSFSKRGERCSFLRKEKRTKRFTEASASDSHPAADSRVHTAPGMTDSRVFRVRRHSPCGCRPRLIGLRLRARGKGKPSQKNGRRCVRFSFILFRKGGRLRRRVPAGCRHAR